MELDLARQAIEAAARFGVSQVRFFLAGEPVFHPHLDKLISIAVQKGLLTQVHTNANYLDAKRSEKLIASGLHSISFSFDGETKEEYESIRVGGDFEKTLANIIQFLQIKRDNKSRYPFVTFQVIKPFKPGAPFSPSISKEFKQQFDGLPIDRFVALYPFSWPGQEEQDFVRTVGKNIFPCPVIWQSLSVGWDGRILGCCGDLNGMVTLGDVHKDRLEDVWNGEKLIEMRRLHLRAKFRDIPLCRDCDVVYVRAHPAIRDLKDLITGKWNLL